MVKIKLSEVKFNTFFKMDGEVFFLLPSTFDGLEYMNANKIIHRTENWDKEVEQLGGLNFNQQPLYIVSEYPELSKMVITRLFKTKEQAEIFKDNLNQHDKNFKVYEVFLTFGDEVKVNDH